MDRYRDIIALSMLNGVGPIIAKSLLAAFESAEGVFSASRADIKNISGIGSSVADIVVEGKRAALIAAEVELENMAKRSIQPIAYTDANYPKRLLQLDSSPVVLYSKGKTDFNALKVLSVIGTRRPSEQGREICTQIVTDIAKRHTDVLIVSGLAYGIDVLAHRAALQCGVPTVGVMAHGLDIIYPSQHRDTAAQMINNGALLSEYIIGTEPDAPNFVSRNRIVAGMADATLVVESGAKGGSLITARNALSMGRDVLAVPGRPSDEMSVGCNNLIRENKAHLVTCAKDIEDVLCWTAGNAPTMPIEGSLFAEPLTVDQQAIYDTLMLSKGMSASVLSRQTGLAVSKVNTLLLQMEFSGMVKSMPGNIYKLVK